jgi:hypothetical protein
MVSLIVLYSFQSELSLTQISSSFSVFFFFFVTAVKESTELKKTSNPLSDFIDPITLEEVEEPAISPFGHVMG